jgi:hypothetical protein
VTREARDGLPPSKIAIVQILHHGQHSARDYFCFQFVVIVRRLIVAVLALYAERRLKTSPLGASPQFREFL